MSHSLQNVLVRLSTPAGDITISILRAQAPRAAKAFLDCLDAQELEGVQFIRAVRLENDNANPKIEVLQTLPSQFDVEHLSRPFERTNESSLFHCDGSISFAESDDGFVSPTAFFISIGNQPELDFGGSRRKDKRGFTVFGQVVEGMDIVRGIHRQSTASSSPFPGMLGQILENPVPIVSAHRVARNPSSELSCLANEFWEFRCREFPAETGDGDGARAFNPFGGIAPPDFDRRLKAAKALLRRADVLGSLGLSNQETVTLELLIGQLTNIIDGCAVGEHLTPQLFPFGFTELPAYVLANMSIQTQRDCLNFAEKLKAIPAYFEGGLENLKLARSQGYRIPRVLAPRIRGMIDAQLAEGGLSSLIRDRFSILPSALVEGEFHQLRREAERIVDEDVRPALLSLREQFSDEAVDLWRDSISICDQPNGKEYYCFKVKQQTTTNLTPSEIHDLGQEEVAWIHQELDKLLDEAGFDGDAYEYAARLSSTTIASSGIALLERARAICKKIDGTLPLLFGRLPRITYDIRSFSFDQSLQRPPAMIQAAPADFTQPGVFWLTSIPERCPTYMLLPLCLHEAWPGHLLQFSLAQENIDLPHFRRQTSFYYNAYIEGWALYCEKLGYDVGLYKDIEDRFGQLVSDLWRAARLVVDTGIHWQGWSREKAINYLEDNSFLPNETILSEVDRYIGMPAQALSYKIGERVIFSLRDESKRRLGDKFSLRDFHDQILSTGAVSLSALEKIIRNWIDSESADLKISD